jgi:hypothetical protein
VQRKSGALRASTPARRFEFKTPSNLSEERRRRINGGTEQSRGEGRDSATTGQHSSSQKRWRKKQKRKFSGQRRRNGVLEKIELGKTKGE